MCWCFICIWHFKLTLINKGQPVGYCTVLRAQSFLPMNAEGKKGKSGSWTNWSLVLLISVKSCVINKRVSRFQFWAFQNLSYCIYFSLIYLFYKTIFLNGFNAMYAHLKIALNTKILWVILCCHHVKLPCTSQICFSLH